MRRRALLASVATCLLLAGCGTEVYQTRYIPRPSEMSWDKDYEQLPWRPPSLGNEHYHRRGKPAKARFPYETHYDIARPIEAYRYYGDRKEGDSGNASKVEPAPYDKPNPHK